MNKLMLAAGLSGALALAVPAQQPPPNQSQPPPGGPAPGQQYPPGAPIRQRVQQFMQQRGGGPGGAPWMQQRGGPGLQQMRGPMGAPGGEQKIDHGEALRHILSNPEVAKRIGVTDEQIAKIKDLQFAHEKAMIDLRAKAETAKLDVRKLMESDKVDRDALSKAIDAAAASESAARKAEILHMLDIKETLGADTMKKIKEGVRERLQRAMPGRGGSQGPGPQAEGKR